MDSRPVGAAVGRPRPDGNVKVVIIKCFKNCAFIVFL
jgi:hypothetical protein